MGRPRKYATNAERQAAYRSRTKPAQVGKVVGAVRPPVVVVDTKKVRCSAYAPHGTKCKFCGKSH